MPEYNAEDFAAVLRDEAVRRVDDRYVHHALIRNQMRDMADRIERWERGEFKTPTPPPSDRSLERCATACNCCPIPAQEALAAVLTEES